MLFSARATVLPAAVFFGVGRTGIAYAAPQLAPLNTVMPQQAMQIAFLPWGFIIWAFTAWVAWLLGLIFLSHGLPLSIAFLALKIP